MNDPLATVRPGDDASILMSARRHNAYAAAAKAVLGQQQSVGAAGSPRRVTSAPLVVMVCNRSGEDLQQFEAIGLHGLWFDVDENLEEASRLTYEGRTAHGEFTSYYGRWGICQEPMKNGAWGQVCIWGPTLARLADRTEAKGQCVDIHPSPADGTRDTHRVSRRTHGLGRIVKAAGTLDGDDIYHIDIGGGTFQTVVVLKENTAGSGSAACYTVAGKDYYFDPDDNRDAGDEITVLSTEWQSMAGVGVDTERGYFLGKYTYGIAEATVDAGYEPTWRVVWWPDRIPCESLIGYDDDRYGGGQLSLKFLGDVDDNAFSAWVVSLYGALGAGPTVAIAPNSRVELRWYEGLWRVDPTPYIEAPYGTIRINGFGFGWKLCDGTNGTPDLRNRFLMGEGSGWRNWAEANGGYLYHGDAEEPDGYPNAGSKNNHADHVFTPSSHSTTVNVNQGAVASGEGASRVSAVMVSVDDHDQITLEHNANDPMVISGNLQATDNRPPYVKVMYAMRVKAT